MPTKHKAKSAFPTSYLFLVNTHTPILRAAITAVNRMLPVQHNATAIALQSGLPSVLAGTFLYWLL